VGLAERLAGLRYTTVYCRTLRYAERYDQHPAVRAAPGGTTSAERCPYRRAVSAPPGGGRTVKNFSRRAFNFCPAAPILNVGRYRIAPPPLGRLTQRPNGQKE